MNPVSFLHRHLLWEPPVPVASFASKTVIVTGGNTGLGLETSRLLVRLGVSRLILACRSIEKGQAAAKDIQRTTSCAADVLDVWELDMSSYASVIAFADKVNTALPRLDAVLANAGVMVTKFRHTEGNEESITTNVISTTLLAFLLFPKLRETAKRFKTQSHISVPGSELYELAKLKERYQQSDKSDLPLFSALNDEDKANMGDRYNVTKLLIVLVVRQIATIAPLESNNVVISTVSPGFCQSNLGEKDMGGFLFSAFKNSCARPTEYGARMLVAGLAAGPETHGQYVRDVEVRSPRSLAEGKEGAELQRQVWQELRSILERIRPGVTDLRG